MVPAARRPALTWLLAMLLAGPLGCDLIEGDFGAWIVQASARREPNFRASRTLGVRVEPADLDLYRRLLPSPFEMPEHPMLGLSVTDNLEVGPWPLTPYQLGNVSLRCAYRGEEGWHVLDMPENQIIAIWSGRTMGFPKYRARVRLEAEGGGWVGEVRDGDRPKLRLAFRPDPQAPPPVWVEQGWAMGGPTFNLIPPSRGPRVKTIRSDVADAGETQSVRGVVRVEIGPAEPWAGLLASGSEVVGALSEWHGGTSLAPED